MAQRLAVKQLHDDQGMAVGLTDVVDGADIGMLKGGDGSRLAVEALLGLERIRR
jgi:hypothetical protein